MNENAAGQLPDKILIGEKSLGLGKGLNENVTPRKLTDEQMGKIEDAIATAQRSQTEIKPINLHGAAINERNYSQPQFLGQTPYGQMRYSGAQSFDLPAMQVVNGPAFTNLKGPGETTRLFESKDKIAYLLQFFEEYNRIKDAAEQAKETAYGAMISKLFNLLRASENPQEAIALLKSKIVEAKTQETYDQGLGAISKDAWLHFLENMKKEKPETTLKNTDSKSETS